MKRMFWVLPAALALLGGCQKPVELLPRAICPGKATVEEAVAALNERQANFHPLRASVDATLEWIDEDGREKREHLDAQLRYIPTERLFLRGDKFGEIRFGTNPEAFWLMIKPELDSYWWGTRQAGERCAEAIPFQPWHVAEALGAVELDTDWTLSYEGGYDVLTKTGPSGQMRKRIWIGACDYLIERIEIYPAVNEIVRILLGSYETTDQGYAVPSDIRIEQYRDTDVIGAMELELNGIRLFEPTEKQLERLFERPSSENYEKVYMLTENCEFIQVNKEPS